MIMMVFEYERNHEYKRL